jgi:hypothetical protein
LARLSADWQQKYGHPVLVVESFVDPEQFCGTVYTANGWQELGPTDGWGRCSRDYYVKHDKPKRLFVKELCKNACRNLQAQQLKPALALVEDKIDPRCTQRVPQIRSLTQHLKQVPEFRARVESYPLWSLLAIVACAILSGAQRGPKALAGFAKKLSQAQRRALGIRPDAKGWYPAPSAPTFSRALQAVDPEAIDRAVLDFQTQVRGLPPPEELVALDGKEPKHGGGHSILSAVSVPSQYYLGSAVVDQKTNEIPVARKLFPKLDLEGRFVSLDALHTPGAFRLTCPQWSISAHALRSTLRRVPARRQQAFSGAGSSTELESGVGSFPRGGVGSAAVPMPGPTRPRLLEKGPSPSVAADELNLLRIG